VAVWAGAAQQAEPFVVAHPSKAGVVIIGTGDWVAGRGLVPHAYATTDGGTRWTRVSLPGLPDDLGATATLEGGGDPWIAFDTAGRVYFSVNFFVPGRGSPVRLFSSADSGATWEKTFSLDEKGAWDAPMILPLAAPRGPGLLLIVGASGTDLSPFGASARKATGVAVFRSADGGASFAPAALIAPGEHSYGTEYAVQLADGTVLILFAEFGIVPAATGTLEARYNIVRSRDGGRTFGPPTLVGSVPRQYPDRAGLAADRSRGRFSGRVYATWEAGDFGAQVSFVNGQRVRQEAGTHRSVVITRSDNQGQTWSTPVSLEVAGAGPAYTSTVAVSSSGTVGVLWVQHEHYETNPLCYRAYFSASMDGGESFAMPVPVSDARSCPARSSTVDFFTYRPRGGDYIGLAAAADGSFHAAWSDARGGAFKTLTARILVER
jgi:hypothetical protein